MSKVESQSLNEQTIERKYVKRRLLPLENISKKLSFFELNSFLRGDIIQNLHFKLL